MSERKCCRCGVVKPFTDYAKGTVRKDGTASWCKACFSLYARQRYALNPAPEIARCAKYNREHPEVARRSMRKYWREKPEKAKAARAAWVSKNLELVRHCYKQNSARRKARKKEGKVSKAEWDALKIKFGNKCAYCGKKFDRLSMDHVVPLALGGEHSIANIAPACISCNSRKRSLPPAVFAQEFLGRLL